MKLILTRELGRLAKWLRIFGLDTIYFKQPRFARLLLVAMKENRIILTKNTRIGNHRGVRIVRIKSDILSEQLSQSFKELNIEPKEDKMFSRCTICNEELTIIPKDEAKSRVPELVFQAQEKFLACPKCSRVYWQGTHWGNVSQIMEEIMANNQKPENRSRKNE